METKTKYRIRNWSQYNRSLVQRGSINVWFSEDSIKKWNVSSNQKKKGRPYSYSDDAILTGLLIRVVYNLPLRGLQGFLISIVAMLNLSLSIPCYTQISRRAKSLEKKLTKLSKKNITDLVIDSTGLKVYGEGEWKVRQHGYTKRRTWRKLHLAVCPDSGEIFSEVLTENSVTDGNVFPDLIKDAPKTLRKTYGDGAYDKKACYHASAKHGIKHIAPPQKNARIQSKAPPWMNDRNKAIRTIVALGGDAVARKLWKILTGYHRRSLSETAMFRFKQIFGSDLKSRLLSTQRAETRVKCIALNKMTALGMPKGEWCCC